MQLVIKMARVFSLAWMIYINLIHVNHIVNVIHLLNRLVPLRIWPARKLMTGAEAQNYLSDIHLTSTKATGTKAA